MHKRILFVAPPDRPDFYRYLEQDASNEYHQIWFDTPAEMAESGCATPGFVRQTHFWGDHATPARLLRAVRPDKVVLMEIIDLHQVALVAAARRMGIPTLFLDHGAAGDREAYLNRIQSERTFLSRKLLGLLRRPSRLWSFLKTRFFYLSAASACSPASRPAYLLLSLRLSVRPVMQVLRSTRFPERNPAQFILFSEANADQYRICFDFDDQSIHRTGVPDFDRYFRPNKLEASQHLVFIDHPYLEFGLFRWTEEHHEKLARTLERVGRAHGCVVNVKLHPTSDLSRWESYQLDPRHVRILRAGDFDDIYLSARLILGFASSMLTGFLCARKNVVLVDWHPSPLLVRSNFSSYDICHVSTELHQAEDAIPLWASRNRCEENAEGYEAFLARYNTPFDGRAAGRILGVLGA